MAPLLFCALLLAAVSSSNASPSLWLGTLGIVALACRLAGGAASTLFSPIAVAIGCYALWLAATNAWLSPAYSAAAPYHGAILVAGFVLGRRLWPRDMRALVAAGIALGVVIAVWAMSQAFTSGTRGAALFEAPATLAAVINLLVIPLLAVLAWHKRSPILVGAAMVMLLGLAMARSLGSMVGLIGGLLTLAIFARRAGVAGRRSRALGAVAAVLVVGLAAYLVIGRNFGLVSARARWDLWQLAWQEVHTVPLTGAGYLTFFYLPQSMPAPLLTYEGSVTYFVHNDYLQTLLELGIPGLAALLGMVILPLALAWRAVPGLRDRSARVAVIAVVAGMSSMATHALVDFPFYIPMCLLLYGICAGILVAIATPVTAPAGRPHGSLAHVARAAAVALAVWVLALPVAAEGVAYYATRQWREGNGADAAFWFESARRIEPRDWRYHWYAGQFWYAQGRQGRQPSAARLADRAFAAGFAANPRDVHNLVGRIHTHRDLGGLLASPADEATLREWTRTAVRLAPRDPAVRALREKT
jgi:O-antigen ligase